MALVALVALAAGCGGAAGYSPGAETAFVAGCSKAATKAVSANLGAITPTADEAAAVTSYCRTALSCLEGALSPGDFLKVSKALKAGVAMEQRTATAMGICTKTASESSHLDAAFAHEYPPAVRAAFAKSCRSSAVSKVRRGVHLTAGQKAAVGKYCDATFVCTTKAVTLTDFSALDTSLRAGKPADRKVQAAINGCAKTYLPALKRALRA